MARPLKVFRAHLGFYDTVVAAPSQKAALAAWGARVGEFRQGFAQITHDADAVTAALAKPGVVLRRLFGSHDPFKPEIDAATFARAAKSVGGPAGHSRAGTAKSTKAERTTRRAQAREAAAAKAAARQEAKRAAAAARQARAAERRKEKERAQAELAALDQEEQRLRERRRALRATLRGRR